MKKSYDYDAIVVGAGPGGTTAASLLANEGKRILLVDKNAKPGGRMITVSKDGFSYELFPINCVPCRNSLFERLTAELDKKDKVKLITSDDFGEIGLMYYEDIKGNIRSWNMGGSTLKMLAMLGIKLYKLKALFQTIKVLKRLATIKPSEIEKLYDISAMEYVNSIGKLPLSVYTYLLASFCEGVFEMTADKVSAAEMIKIFQDSMKNSGGRYYNGGIGHFFEIMAETVEENNGKLLMKTRVVSIKVTEGSVTGITTEKGEDYTAPIVISNAGIRQTVLKLVGEQHFEKEYVKTIKALENNLACAGYRYFLNAPVLKHPMIVYYPEGCAVKMEEFERMAKGESKPKHNYIYIGSTSLYPNMSPVGKQVAYACMSCLADPEADIRPYLDYVEERAKKIVPELFDHIERREIMAPAHVPAVGNDIILEGQGGEAYGIALSVGQSGDKQPKGDTPIKGLYIVGNDSAGSGLGTHQAVDSGFKVADLVKRDSSNLY